LPLAPQALVLVALQIIAFFAINPFLIALPDWRNTIIEEASSWPTGRKIRENTVKFVEAT